MDVLRANVRHLMAGRSVNSVADAAGVGQSWLHRLLNPDKAGGTQSRPSPDKVAKLAAFFNVSPAALTFQNLTDTPAPASQPAGSEQAIVAAAVKLVQYLDELAPAPPELLADRIFIALQVVREEGADGVLDGSRFVEASRLLAARLRAVG